MVEQLTTLARLDGASLAQGVTIDPSEMAEHVVGALAPLVYATGKSIELVDKDATPFEGHPDLVQNALRNLIENAVRHTGQGASIRVEAGPGAAFSICDDGGRMDGDRAPKFPAATADKLGLGLKIVHRIAEMHGGSFDMRKAPGMGPSRGSLSRRPVVERVN